MLAWIARLAGGISLSGWLLGGAAAVAIAYVAGSQIVLHNRQRALDEAQAAGQRLAADKATLSAQLDDAQALNADNLRVLARLQADQQRAEDDLAALQARRAKVGRTLVVVQQENARDPDARRPLGDVCPLLDRYLERVLLEGGAAAAPAAGDQGRAGRGEASGRPADLRGRAAGPAAPVGR